MGEFLDTKDRGRGCNASRVVRRSMLFSKKTKSEIVVETWTLKKRGSLSETWDSIPWKRKKKIKAQGGKKS